MSGASAWRKIKKFWRKTDVWHAFQGVYCGIMFLLALYTAIRFPGYPLLWFIVIALGGVSVLGFRLAWGDLPSPDQSSDSPAPR